MAKKKKHCCKCRNQGKGCYQGIIYPINNSLLPRQACIGNEICLFESRSRMAKLIRWISKSRGSQHGH